MAFMLPIIRNFLSRFLDLSHKFSEQRERRIGDHDVRLFQQVDALCAAEVAIAFQRFHAYFFRIGYVVAVLVALVFQIDRLVTFVLAEEVAFLILIAGGDEAFQPQIFKLVGEIMEEIADARVVAVAEYRLAAEVLFVVLQFILNVGQLGIKLVIFGLVRLGEGAVVVCHFCD
jgi:hypothetical protein